MSKDPYQAQRERMVESQLRRRGLSDDRVLHAFEKVPRHEFVPASARNSSYADTPISIGHRQTISQPYMVACMTEAAQISSGDRVLEIGTGSGYQAAILAEMGAEVFSIERFQELADQALETLTALGYDIELRVGDGTLGWPEAAPFDGIIVTAGAPQTPQPLVDQLALGGRLVVPVEDGLSQILHVIERTEEGIRDELRDRCTFVPLIGEHGWDQ